MKKITLTKAQATELYGEDFMQQFSKAATSDPLRGPREEPDDDKLTTKLKEFASLMVTVDPSKSEAQHLFDFINTAHGRKRAEHLNNLSKGETTMSRVDELKVIAKADGGMDSIISYVIAKGSTDYTEHELTEAGMEYCRKNRQPKETVPQAFARYVDENPDYSKALKIANGLALASNRDDA
jgi:hypothetical protein